MQTFESTCVGFEFIAFVQLIDAFSVIQAQTESPVTVLGNSVAAPRRGEYW